MWCCSNEVIDEYMSQLATENPSFVEYVESIGPSVEGNPIRAMVIGALRATSLFHHLTFWWSENLRLRRVAAHCSRKAVGR